MLAQMRKATLSGRWYAERFVLRLKCDGDLHMSVGHVEIVRICTFAKGQGSVVKVEEVQSSGLRAGERLRNMTVV